MAFTLDNIVPWGRSFDEYVRMFKLTSEDLQRRIFGCGDGPASFNCEMHNAGNRIISIDPLYQFSAKEIEGRIAETSKEILRQLEESREDYLWDVISSPEELGQTRMTAMRDFLADFPAGKQEGRYLPGQLPALPFNDQQFDLALCSHLLFLYSEQLSLEFHKVSVSELCRVAKEVRIFPLVTLVNNRSPFLAEITSHLESEGCQVTIEKVPYEFQRGGNEMMKIQN